MAITLDDAKNYLRIDYDYDDDFILQCIASATSYMKNAVSDFETLYAGDTSFAKTADQAEMALISEMYNNRDARNDSRSNYSYIVRSMIAQLQNYPS